MNYSISEFRKNIREALNKVEAGELVVITRHNSEFVVTTAKQWNGAMTEAQQSGITRLITDDKSHDIRPDIHPRSIEPLINKPTTFFEIGVDPAKVNGDISIEKKIASDSQANELPCCEKRTPCKHWIWSEDQQVYINTLSNRERQPE